jgi:hypothetical protein
VGDLSRMSSLEYTYWLALNNLAPIGLERADYHAAQVVTTLANLHRDPKKPAHRLTDFLMFHDKPEPDDDEIAEQLFALFPPPSDESGDD